MADEGGLVSFEARSSQGRGRAVDLDTLYRTSGCSSPEQSTLGPAVPSLGFECLTTLCRRPGPVPGSRGRVAANCRAFVCVQKEPKRIQRNN